MMNKFNPFHSVSMNPWPLMSSIMMYNMMLLTIFNMYVKTTKTSNAIFALLLVYISANWWKNTSMEANKEGLHVTKVMEGIKMGMILFIMSEVLFFTSFFWGYFHCSMGPNIEIGQSWPPQEIKPFNPINVPLLNTIILISSGFSITLSHHFMLENKLKKTMKMMSVTLLLGVYFSTLQWMEYKQAEFSLSDSSYGTIFFMATGFHGVHVLIGSSFILMNILMIKKLLTSKKHHMGFELSAWYWHFVDVVWLFLYLSVYWGGK